MLFVTASSWVGRGGVAAGCRGCFPLLAAAAVFATRNGPRDSPHNGAGPPGSHGAGRPGRWRSGLAGLAGWLG
jgi:hypothetical protein